MNFKKLTGVFLATLMGATAAPALAQDVASKGDISAFAAGIELLELGKKFNEYKQAGAMNIVFVGLVEGCEGPAFKKVDGQIVFEDEATPMEGTFAQFADSQGVYTVCTDLATLNEFAVADSAYFAELLDNVSSLRPEIESRMIITGGGLDDNERAYLAEMDEAMADIVASRNKGVTEYAKAAEALKMNVPVAAL